ncbi:recombinase family protein [Lichenicoccus sp.]|uniref:recombinase family protein n=1 Tax=Lichenicoccus sp. TaxID=2781899 RepID=UPI003D11C077
MPLRVAIYARYSSENQSEHSIDDQVRTCRARAEREGWTVVEVYADYAFSGATTNRPRLQSLASDARSGCFDIVLAEALDRISRDQEHTAGIWKLLAFAGVTLTTLSEGEISELHVGLKGAMNALFLKDLAAKTHRGLAGRVEAGKSGGGLSYGYRVARHFHDRGDLVRGERIICPAEALIVQRIFALFAAGSSPIAIAKTLNGEGLTGPGGKPWRDTTVRGHATRGTGILRNELYIGRLVWNRMHYVRDPATGNRVSRLNPRDARITVDVPKLRIIDDELWARVQARLGDIRSASGADDPERPRFWDRRRAQHILTGKVFCGCCGGAFSNSGRDYLACNAAKKQGVCDNRRSIRRQTLDDLVLDAMRTQLMDPGSVAAFISEFTAEWNRVQAEKEAGREQQERELAQVQRKLAGLIDALAEGFRGPGLQKQLDQLEARRSFLEDQLASATATAPRLHPNLATLYRDRVAALQEALKRERGGQEALEIARGLIERITVGPVFDAAGLVIDITGEIGAMLSLGLTDRRNAASPAKLAGDETFVRSVKVVAGTGFEPVTFRL